MENQRLREDEGGETEEVLRVFSRKPELIRSKATACECSISLFSGYQFRKSTELKTQVEEEGEYIIIIRVKLKDHYKKQLALERNSKKCVCFF